MNIHIQFGLLGLLAPADAMTTGPLDEPASLAIAPAGFEDLDGDARIATTKGWCVTASAVGDCIGLSGDRLPRFLSGRSAGAPLQMAASTEVSRARAVRLSGDYESFAGVDGATVRRATLATPASIFPGPSPAAVPVIDGARANGAMGPGNAEFTR